MPLTPEGIKPDVSALQVTRQWGELHLEIGIEAMTEIGEKGEPIKDFTY